MNFQESKEFQVGIRLLESFSNLFGKFCELSEKFHGSSMEVQGTSETV